MTLSTQEKSVINVAVEKPKPLLLIEDDFYEKYSANLQNQLKNKFNVYLLPLAKKSSLNFFSKSEKIDLDKILEKIANNHHMILDVIVIVLVNSYNTIDMQLNKFDKMLKTTVNLFFISDMMNINKLKLASRYKNVKYKRIANKEPWNWEREFQKEFNRMQMPSRNIKKDWSSARAFSEDLDFLTTELNDFKNSTLKSKNEIIQKEEERISQEEKVQQNEIENQLDRIDRLKREENILSERREKLENEVLERQEELNRLKDAREMILNRIDEDKRRWESMSSEMLAFKNRLNSSIEYLENKSKISNRVKNGLYFLDDFVLKVNLNEYQGIPNNILDDLNENILTDHF